MHDKKNICLICKNMKWHMCGRDFKIYCIAKDKDFVSFVSCKLFEQKRHTCSMHIISKP